jgi:hypothetical protein
MPHFIAPDVDVVLTRSTTACVQEAAIEVLPAAHKARDGIIIAAAQQGALPARYDDE